MYAKRNFIPFSTLAPCARSREIWQHLNELRGLCSVGLWIDCDIRSVANRLERLRDDLAMHYAHEWGGTGGLRDAALQRRIPTETLSLFLCEQKQIYGLISDLSSEVRDLAQNTDVAPKLLKAAMNRFKVFDALLISHESRKSMAIHDN